MQFLRRAGTAIIAASLFARGTRAQDAVPYTDPTTNITFASWTSTTPSTTGGPDSNFTFGMVLPETATTTDEYDYIGILRCSSSNATVTGWCGISHGTSGQMTQALLLMAWPYEGQVLTSFLWASGYVLPGSYNGNATLTTLASTVTDTLFEIVYKCENCWQWDQDGSTGSISTSSGFTVMGRAAAVAGPTDPGCPNDIQFGFHDNGYGQWSAPLTNATSPSYSAWAELPAKPTTTATGCAATPTTTTVPTSTATPTSICKVIPQNKTYDYVIVGAGAGGIPMADRLSEAGKSVLLIEKGPPSSGRYNGTMKPAWLDGTNLTRFDVPGLCNEIWVDSAGIACQDTDQMAGCVLGGGTAINAGLWWKPNPEDWNYNFPEGWKSTDLVGATEKVFQRIPGTWTPSMDGELYLDQGFNVLSSGLAQGGWTSVSPANDYPDKKNRTYGHSEFMFSHGERGGPMATYLVSASARTDVFTMWTDTAVNRIVRAGGHATGVEIDCTSGAGYTGTVNLTPGTGRVIVAAGTFGSAKLLFRSGIGPADQLAVVQSSADGPRMIGNDSWIDLPVGHNLVDHLNTDAIVTHPDVVFYDFYKAWTAPNVTDENAYLGNRTGILTQAAPNIGPMMWEEIVGSDGISRQLQWTSRVEGDSAFTNSTHAMTMSQYLGRGSQSRGRTTITKTLNMAVTTQPFLHNDGDKEVVIKGIEHMQASLAGVQGLQWVHPAPNQTATDYVNSLLVTANGRRSNHWMGTAKMGTDDGRTGGSAVVDVNAQVYGTDNIFVVDASIFPGQPTGNPSAMIVIASEQAAARILALPPPALRRRLH